MKKITRITVASSFAIASILDGCGKASENHQALAKEEINKVSAELGEAIDDASAEAKQKTIDDWQKFKDDSEHQITVMEAQARELSQKVSKTDNQEKVSQRSQLDKVDKKILEEKGKLSQRNADFEQDVKKFDESVHRKNESFQREFKRDMDELGASIKDLLENNNK